MSKDAIRRIAEKVTGELAEWASGPLDALYLVIFVDTIAVCDGLKDLPEAINTTWEQTMVHQCIVHLIRNSFRYAERHRDAIVKSFKLVYTAPSEQAAKGQVRGVRRRVGTTVSGDRAALALFLGAVSCRSWTTTSRSGG
ncbi:transposase [Actinomyces mediterranea]|uniref:transposase n=1 Tax=Actinomyces mediterranea TaxID=1871028 RepID=UPI001966D858|nr:transposase [Actinomyces mediterranea]